MAWILCIISWELKSQFFQGFLGSEWLQPNSNIVLPGNVGQVSNSLHNVKETKTFVWQIVSKTELYLRAFGFPALEYPSAQIRGKSYQLIIN